MPTGATFSAAPTSPRSESAPAASGSKSKFRGDIQGLRAVAVLSVALDHADFGPFPGGYVGVDVFFVISGFLITQLLLAEWQRSGSISLSSFYSRRARRILPAATLVLIATVTAGLVLLNFVRAKSLITDAIWATFFAANVHFGQQGTDYFAADEPPSALQHYWSLAVEEQFYLVWPLLLALLLGALLVWRRRTTATARPSQRHARIRVLVGLGVISAASFIFCVQLTGDNPTAAYFSTLARVWELGLGGAFAVMVPLFARVSKPLRSLMQWSGLALITYAILTFSTSTPFPGSAALVPVLGAALVLGGGCGERAAGVQAVLENKPMQVVGDWSYSLYLWHWPVLILASEYAGHPLAWYQNLMLLLLALGLSGLTYVYVENPFRRAKFFSMRPRQSLLLYPVAVVLTLLVCLGANVQVQREAAATADVAGITTQNFGEDPDSVHFSKNPQRALVEASALAARNHLPIPGNLTPTLIQLGDDKADVGECDYSTDVEKLCERGAVGSDRSLVLFGDSHARHWIPAFDEIAKHNDMSAYFLVKPGCNAAQMDPDVNDEFLAGCLKWRAWAMDQINELQPSVLVMAGDVPDTVFDASGDRVDDDATVTSMYSDGLIETIHMVQDAADQIVVLGDSPGVDKRPVDCLAEKGNDLGDCASKPSERDALELAASARAAKLTGSRFIDPKRWFCYRDLCPTVIGSTIAYWDRNHVTREYALELAGPLDSALRL